MLIDLVQNGHTLRRIDHNGESYVEAPETGTYSIRLTNNSPRARMAVLSVDGLNVVDGTDAAVNGKGYLVEAFGTVDITGWLRDSQEAAAFEFKPSEASYAAGTGRGTKNTGVIGLAVFDGAEKKPRPRPPFPLPQPYFAPYPVPVPYPVPEPYYPRGPWQHPLQPFWSSNTTTTNDAWQGIPISANSAGAAGASAISEEQSLGPTIRGKSGAENYSCDNLRSCVTSEGANADILRSTKSRERRVSLNSAKDLGTGYGQRVAMPTRQTTFTKASQTPALVMALRYATRAKLTEWGVPEVKSPPPVNPFPASTGYAPPPPGWRG